MRYPADPPTVEEIIAVMRQAGDRVHALRIRALIAVLWRAGLRIDEALHLAELDLDDSRGSLVVRHGKGGKRREVGMDDWGWEHLRLRVSRRAELPVGPLFCVIEGPTRGRAWSASAARLQLRRLAADAGSGDASLRISCDTPMPSSWPVKASRSTSSSASWATPTSASRRFTSRASTRSRSSTPSTHDEHL